VPPNAPAEVFAEAARRRGLAIAQKLENTLKALQASVETPRLSREQILKLGANLTALRRERSTRG
jgi:hypothetical protein